MTLVIYSVTNRPIHVSSSDVNETESDADDVFQGILQEYEVETEWMLNFELRIAYPFRILTRLNSDKSFIMKKYYCLSKFVDC